MKFGTVLLLSLVLWTGVAVYHENMAATYISVGGHALFAMLHVIEVKINALLDERGLSAPYGEAMGSHD